MQFQHQTQQYEQNLTNFNYVYGHAFTRKNALFGGLHVDKTYFAYQVTQQDHVMKGSCDFMRGNPS